MINSEKTLNDALNNGLNVFAPYARTGEGRTYKQIKRIKEMNYNIGMPIVEFKDGTSGFVNYVHIEIR